MRGILDTIVCIVLVLWALGLVIHVAGGLIHILLVIAFVVFVFNVIASRKPI
ncbi:MAG: lmo0937 family membrane protein [Capsulimonadaceae bacterium]